MLMKIPKNSLEQPFIMKIRKRVMSMPVMSNYIVFKQKPSLTLPPDSDSATQAVKNVNFKMKIWL